MSKIDLNKEIKEKNPVNKIEQERDKKEIGNEENKSKVNEEVKLEKQVIARNEKGQYEKGTSGNPKGKPIVSITSEIKRELAKVPKGKKKNKLSQLIKVIFDKALKDKDDKMIGRIWNFVDGLPRQQTDIKLDTELTINIIDTYDPKKIEEKSSRKLVKEVEEVKQIEPHKENIVK